MPTIEERLGIIETDIKWIKQALQNRGRNGVAIHLSSGGLGGAIAAGLMLLARLMGIL